MIADSIALRAVLFDFDGTLADSEQGQRTQRRNLRL
jgi:phosphoglycolate phosphatase-like HAD superfamily hydrolase